MKATRLKVDLDATAARLQHVGLEHAVEMLGERLAEGVKTEASTHAFLDRLLDDERAFREERRVRTSLGLSGLPTGDEVMATAILDRRSALESGVQAGVARRVGGNS
jgi:ornithine cyclodeaminase/alanine dehydrogenase-like protein (mu-crystallin family)